MKQIVSIIFIVLSANNFVTAQDSGVDINGPTCIAVGDTVTYKVNKALPGYHWGYPPGMSWLYSADDNTNVTYVVQSTFQSMVRVWYGPSTHTSNGAVTLSVYARAGKPYFYFTTEGQPWQVVQDVPLNTKRLYINISPPMQLGNSFKYQLSSDNLSWTFGNEYKPNVETAKSFGAQRIRLNIGTGKTDITIKTTGACDTRNDITQLVKPD